LGYTIDMNALEKALIDTCIWFDIFDRPLTEEEFFSYLLDVRHECKDITRSDINNALRTQFIREHIVEHNGVFCIKSRRALLDEYDAHTDIRIQKWNRARMYVRAIQKFPFVKAIAVCNTLAFDAVRDDSDIDLFIITESGRVWSTRFLATVLADIRGWREEDNDSVCLSFFVDEKSLDISSYMIDDEDIYFRYWIGGLAFVYDDGGVKEQFWKANKTYVRNSLPHIEPRVVHDTNPRISAKNSSFLDFFHRYNKRFMRWMCGIISERMIRKVQEKFFITHEVRVATDGKKVVLGDGVLKFHTNDRRKEYNEEFKKHSAAL
jgi:hypothetical protein